MGNYNKFAVEFDSVFWDENITMLGVTPNNENFSGMMVDWLNLFPVTGNVLFHMITLQRSEYVSEENTNTDLHIRTNSGLPALIAFTEGDEAFSSENLSDEQLLEIGILFPINSVSIVSVFRKTLHLTI